MLICGEERGLFCTTRLIRMTAVKKAGRKKSGKTASIYDVAKLSRVSVFTVSAVVNHKSHVGEKLRKRVEAAIRKLNYRPNLIARSLANQRTHTIGMIVPDIANPFFPMVVRGAEDAAQTSWLQFAAVQQRRQSCERREIGGVAALEARGWNPADEGCGGFSAVAAADDQGSEHPFRAGDAHVSEADERRSDYRRLSGRVRRGVPPGAFRKATHRIDRRARAR